MEKGLDVNINAEVKADLQPVISSTPKAVNKLFELLFGVKHAQKLHKMAMIEAQKNKDKESIENGLAIFNIEEMKLESLDDNIANQPTSLVEYNTSSDETRNIIKCARHAAAALGDREATPEKEISRDFFNRWRNEAKLIDDDYAQSIWGLILAEEIQKPDTISLRALDTLKNLSKDEAELFNQMGNYVVFDSSIITGEHIKEHQIKILAEAGLAIFAGVYRTDKWPRTRLTYKDDEPIEGHYFDFNDILFFTNDIPIADDLSFSFIPLTTQGKAIYKIASLNNTWDCRLISKAIFAKEKSLKRLTTYKYNNKNINNDINMDKPTYFERDDFDSEEKSL